MKKYLQLSLMCLLVLAAGVFSSCKDDESEGAYSPLLGMSVKMAKADSLVKTLVSIDHANRLVTISMSQDAVDLEHVECSFDLVKGASLYTPSITNPVMLDLSGGNGGVNILTGDKIVCYKVIPEVDYAVRGVKAAFGSYSCKAVIYQKTRVIDLHFSAPAGAVDLSKVDVDFDISAVTKMGDNGSASRTMDLTADTTYVDFVNDFSGRSTYKVICWTSPEYADITGNDAVSIEMIPGDTIVYAIGIKGDAPSISMGQFSTQAPVLAFEYKTSAKNKTFNRPLLKLGADDDFNSQLYGYELSAASEWTKYTLELDMTCWDINPDLMTLPGIKIDLTAAIGDTLYIRNIQVRSRNVLESLAAEEAYPIMFEEKPDGAMPTTDLTGKSPYPTYQFDVTTMNDPNRNSVNRKMVVGAEYNQIHFWYKTDYKPAGKDGQLCIELFWVEEGGYSLNIVTNLPSSPNVWIAVHSDLKKEVESLFKGRPTAGRSGTSYRLDPFGMAADDPKFSLTMRGFRLAKKYEETELVK